MKARKILSLVSETASKQDITSQIGLALKGAAFFDVKEVDDKYIVKVSVFGAIIAKYEISQDLSEIDFDDPEDTELKAFLAELKKRIA